MALLAMSLTFTCGCGEYKSNFKLNMGDEARINAGSWAQISRHSVTTTSNT
jgi:hypothetical protein